MESNAMIVYSLSIGCLVLIGGALLVVYRFFISPGSFKRLSKGFKRKMYMTFGLGIVFFGFYAIAIRIGADLASDEKAHLFRLMRIYPVESVYAGLTLFVLVSVSICLVRTIIKYLCLMKEKDS